MTTRRQQGRRGRQTPSRRRGRADEYTTRAERKSAAAQRFAAEMRTVSERDVDVLARLVLIRRATARVPALRGFARARHIGGRMHSHHSHTLAKLAAHGLVETRNRPSLREYRVTDAGLRALAAIRAVR